MPVAVAPPPIAWAASVRSWLRLLRSELGLVFLRRRNLALLGVLAAVPVVLGIVLKFSSPQPGSGGRWSGVPFPGACITRCFGFLPPAARWGLLLPAPY